MKPRVACLAFIAAVFLSTTARAAEETSPAEKPPAPLDAITAAPENRALKMHSVVNHDGDGIGEELPSSILYSEDDKDFATFMTVTDQRLCKRPSEKAICEAFLAMIAGPPPKLGTDVSGSRIGGSDYGTVFLVPLTSVTCAGVDAFTAFLGADSQDPPLSALVLYIYARKGTSLIQVSTSVASCNAPTKKGESDVAYYKRNCGSPANLEKAAARGKRAAEIFRLQ